MRLKDYDSWDKGHKHIGVLGRGEGTVLVRLPGFALIPLLIVARPSLVVWPIGLQFRMMLSLKIRIFICPDKLQMMMLRSSLEVFLLESPSGSSSSLMSKCSTFSFLFQEVIGALVVPIVHWYDSRLESTSASAGTTDHIHYKDDLVFKASRSLLGPRVDVLPKGTFQLRWLMFFQKGHFSCVGEWVVNATIRKKLNVLSFHLTSSKSLIRIARVVSEIQKEKGGCNVYIVGAANVRKSAFINAA
nr:NO-associated protein 1, chloroplastic/mitochondrial [Tanacetum cinerariifolium]